MELTWNLLLVHLRGGLSKYWFKSQVTILLVSLQKRVQCMIQNSNSYFKKVGYLVVRVLGDT